MKIYTFDNKIMYTGGKWMEHPSATPPGPVLPPFTIRAKFTSGYTPSIGDAQTLVDAGQNIWDITKNDTSWDSLFRFNTSLLEILAANSLDVTNMDSMFYGCSNLNTVLLFDTSSVTVMNSMFASCSNLTTVPLFDTSSVTEMYSMFERCSLLTSVPLFDTSLAINMDNMFNSCTSLTTVPLLDTSSIITMEYMFYGCMNVQSGALALYQQASTQATPPEYHSSTFYNCGINTTTGAAELAQIPSDWK